jgi:site-specific recombinase XerD
MIKPVITVKKLHHSNGDYFALYFAYDRHLIETVKKIAGARWSNTHRCWIIPNTQENFHLLFEVFKGIAWLDISGIGSSASTQINTKSTKEKRSSGSDSRDKLTPKAGEQVRKMVRNLHADGYSQRSVDVYRWMIEQFLGFCGKDAETFTMEDVRDFQYHFWVKNNYSAATQRQFIAALKHLIRIVPDCNIEPEALVLPKKDRPLPKVLSQPEVISILGAVRNIKHFVMLAILYSSGLRVGELIDLRLEDLDFYRFQIHIRRGKGKKDRYVGMSKHLAPVIQRYITKYRPDTYLLNGQNSLQYTASSVRKVLQRAADSAGIRKRVTPHMLRHSYATHMLEDGVDIRHIQELLGHDKPETTMIYTHVTTKQLTDIKSPLDELVEKLDRDKRNSTGKKFLLSGE